MLDWLPAIIVALVLVVGWAVRIPAALRASITVAKPPAETFAYVANPRNTPRWNPRVKSVTISDDRVGLGTKYELHLEGGAQRLNLAYEVVGYEPTRLYAAATKTAMMSNRFEYEFAPAGTGTRITASLQARVPILQAVVMKVIGSSRTRRNLSLMKAAIESR